IFGFPITELPVLVGIQNEEKDVYMDIVNVKIIDKNGKHLGDCLGDICDVYAVILTQNLEKGNYTIKIGNALQSSDSQHQYLPNILGVGIDVNKEN
ncbi:hypothetical protein, partial [Flavobacterium sp.]|uniref:hypothetical protein n=1 Tax=Flavobacterium sp. TaxID=239 RepID=UPI003528DE8A